MITETAAFKLGKLGLDLGKHLHENLIKIRSKKRDELERLTDVLNKDPVDLVQYYIEPNCQEINPADRHEEDHLVSREPVHDKIYEFMYAKNLDQPGNKQMFILSDAGMGKTSLLIILKLMHMSSYKSKNNGWPKNKACILKVLGPKTIAEIDTVERKRDTVLLLDALDEDSEASGCVKSRLLEILKATKKFFRVIITCRTQYFPEVDTEPFERPGQILVGPYLCPAKYLSLFNEEKIELYLQKRFPEKDGIKRKKAKDIIGKMGSLKFRPMILSYIEQLLDSPLTGANQNEFKIYNALVMSWLIREEEKSGKSRHKILKACEILSQKLAKRGIKEISEKELDLLTNEIPNLGTVKSIDIKGRSLLNRNSFGNYRFAHQCIQEFLITKSIIEDSSQTIDIKIPMTPLIAQLLIAKSEFKRCHHYFNFDIKIFKDLSIHGNGISGVLQNDGNMKDANLKGIDLQGRELIGIDLTGADLQVSKLKKINLENAKLDKADLLGSRLINASLRGSSFEDAVLCWVNMEGADLENADLKGADLEGALLRNANLKGAILNGANLNGADLQGAKLNFNKLLKAHLQGANLQGCNFQGIVMQEADLTGTDLQSTIFRGAICRNVIFKDSNFSFSDLRYVNFQGTSLQGAKFESADLSGATLRIPSKLSTDSGAFDHLL